MDDNRGAVVLEAGPEAHGKVAALIEGLGAEVLRVTSHKEDKR